MYKYEDSGLFLYKKYYTEFPCNEANMLKIGILFH